MFEDLFQSVHDKLVRHVLIERLPHSYQSPVKRYRSPQFSLNFDQRCGPVWTISARELLARSHYVVREY